MLSGHTAEYVQVSMYSSKNSVSDIELSKKKLTQNSFKNFKGHAAYLKTNVEMKNECWKQVPASKSTCN